MVSILAASAFMEFVLSPVGFLTVAYLVIAVIVQMVLLLKIFRGVDNPREVPRDAGEFLGFLCLLLGLLWPITVPILIAKAEDDADQQR